MRRTFRCLMFNPTNRIRMQCLLLLGTLVFALLYLESHPEVPVFGDLSREAGASAVQYGVLAALSWVVVGGRSPAAALALAVCIALLNEGMRYYSSGRSGGIRDVGLDLVGAALIVLLLSLLRTMNTK